MEKKKNSNDTKQKRSDYVKTVRNGGPIAANIFLGKTQDGFEYHYFQLSRAWKSAKQQNTNEFSYSDRFFGRNAEAIATVAKAAGEECEKLDSELDNPVKQAA